MPCYTLLGLSTCTGSLFIRYRHSCSGRSVRVWLVLGDGNSRAKAVQKQQVPRGDQPHSSKQPTMTATSETILLILVLFKSTEPSIIFEDEGTTEASPTFTKFSKSELECFQTGSMFYEPEGKCYKLLQSGPCATNQWLVLDKEQVVTGGGRLRPVCVQCPCCDRPFRAVYWPADGQCHRLLRDSKQLCPSAGTVLQVDPFGEGECACEKEPLHGRGDARNEVTNNDPCYPLYQRGPCDNGYIFVPDDNSTRCEKDPCSQQNNGKSAATYVAWKDGDNQCYMLGSKGPCQSDGAATFNIHPVTRRPACIYRANQIVDLPTKCDRDQNGDCRKEVVLPSQTQYLSDLILSAKKRREKRKARRSKN